MQKKKKPIINKKAVEERKDIKDIIDKSQVFRMIYSGVENDFYYETLYNYGVRNFLMSFHYVQTKRKSFHERFEGKGVKFFIDSGAHTYQNDPQYLEKDLKFWEDFLQKYLKWAEQNKDYVFAIANFDFELLVGGEVVDKWNRDYFEPFMVRTGIPVCFVWHQNSLHDWEYYCQRYPYVGFSSVNNVSNESIELNEYQDKLKTAEKHDCLIHGFGMTKTSLLTQLPYFSCDSTSWNVGVQFGEVNYWNRSTNKMSRLKKDKWKGQYFDELCTRYNLNPEKFLDEDLGELVICNAGAFVEAEHYVQDRLKSHMYWLKAKSNKNDITSLPADFFPSQEWFLGETDQDELREYAVKMNINPDVEEAFYRVMDMAVFLNWDSGLYEEIKPTYTEINEGEEKSYIDNVHDFFINKIAGSFDDKLYDLVKFYSDCLEGKNDKLLHLGTNFDRIVKERESYVEEEEYEEVTLTDKEVEQNMPLLLSADSSNLEEVDKEVLQQTGITIVRDEKGRVIKGSQLKRISKKVYSDKYPKYACDTCMMAQKCPEYSAGYVCAYNKMFKRFNSRNMTDIIDGMQGMVDFNMERMQRAMMSEVLNGGAPDANVTNLINQNMQLLEKLKTMYEYAGSEVLKQTQVLRPDGTRETSTVVQNPQSGGLLASIFMNNRSTEKEEIEEAEVIEVEPEKPRKSVYDNIEE